MADASIDRQLQDTMALARSLEIRGTPGFIIGDRIVPGAAGYAALQAMVDDARATKAAMN